MDDATLVEIRSQLLAMAARRAGRAAAAIDATASIRELGIDSLGLAEFLFDVDDAFGVELGDDVLADASCLDDLAKAVAAARAARPASS